MPPWARWAADVVGIAALYVATGKLGFLLAIPPGNVTILWPPSGLALAAVLLLGNRAWPGIWLGSFLVNAWFFSGITHPLSVTALAISTSIGMGSTLQALLGAGLIRRLIGPGSPIDRPQDVIKFAAIEFASCTVASTSGVTSLSLGGFVPWEAYAYTWWTWWLGDFTGVLIATPLLLAFRQPPWIRWEAWRLAEAVLVLGLLAITSQIVFGEQFQVGVAHYPLEFVLIPFLIWMAVRFDQHGVALSIVIVSGMSIWGTIKGFGPFGRHPLNESLMLLQGFLGIVTVTGLVLAAAIMERRRAEEALRTSERRLAGALDMDEAAVISVDETQRIVFFDQRAERIFGYAAQEVLGQPLDLLLPSRFAEVHRQHVREFSAGAVAARRMGERREVLGRRKDGTEFPAEAAISKLDQAGQPTLTAVLRDITDRKQATAALEQAHAKLTSWVTELEQRTRQITLLSEMGDLLQSCLTAEEAYTVISQFGEKLFPAGSGMLGILDMPKGLVEVAAAWGDGPLGERLFPPEKCWALRRGRLHRVEALQSGLLCRHADPSVSTGSLCIPMMAQGKPLGLLHLRGGPFGPGQPAGSPDPLLESQQRLAVSVAEHIALALANLKLQETLRSQAIHDPLTGLFNRRYMEEFLAREVHRAERGRRSLGVIMFDIDHFKRLNDTFGHDAGDAALRDLGTLLKANLRGGDVACRYGGEEFVIILPEASLDDTRRRAEQLWQAVRRLHLSHRGQSLGPLLLSMGVAAFPKHGDTGEALIRAADAALYRAKNEGRARVVVAG